MTALPNTDEFARIRHFPVPAHNPLNELDASIPLAKPCETCKAPIGKACGSICHRPAPPIIWDAP